MAANTHLEQALEWAEIAVSKQFIGEANFTTLSNQAQVLEKLGRKDEAAAAMEIFQLSFERNGDQWPVHVGLARGYAANGDAKQALEHAKKALTQAPDPLNKQGLEAMIKDLEAGKAIAQ